MIPAIRLYVCDPLRRHAFEQGNSVLLSYRGVVVQKVADPVASVKVLHKAFFRGVTLRPRARPRGGTGGRG